MRQPALSMSEIQAILDDVKFPGRQFLLHKKGDGFLVQMEYMEPDVFHPEKGQFLRGLANGTLVLSLPRPKW